MGTKGIYIYGIVPNFYSPDMFRSLEKTKVYTIPYENISAIVSDRDDMDLDFHDRESLGHLLVHHQQTIEELQSKDFAMFIPMQLGTIRSSKEEVLKILSEGYNLIIDSLKKIEYLTEIDLVVSWADFPEMLRELANHPDIVTLKESLMTNKASISQVDQVMVGMLVQEKIDEKNKLVELAILDSLTSISIDIHTHDVMNDQMILNSAFLIHRNKKEKFEHLIDILDETYHGLLNFKIVGPLPCYSFYTIEVKELLPEHVSWAKAELGLNEETSESEIKKAYLGKAKMFHPDTYQDTDDGDKFNTIQKAYHTLQDYTAAVKQSSNAEIISLAKKDVIKSLTLVKIKD